MNRTIPRRGLALLACPLVLAGAVIAGLTWPAPAAPNRGASIEAAQLLIARGDSQGAERVLRELASSEASFLLGQLLAERGRWREAKLALVKALSDPDQRTPALRLLSQGSMKHGDWESGRRYLLDLEEAEPKDPGVAKALAVCLIQAGDHLGALTAAQRGLALAPEDRDLAKLMSDAAEASVASAARTNAGLPMPRPQRNGRRTR